MTHPFQYNQEIRFIDGKYKGYNGLVKINGAEVAEVEIKVGGEPFRVFEECRFMQDSAQWKAGKSATELALLPT